MPELQPARWPVELRRFRRDKLLPAAIFIEYIPNLHRIDLTNFSEAYLAKFRQIVDEIHDLNIFHTDTYPRNMLIAKGQDGQEDRVLLIDFDRAYTDFPNDDRRREWIEEEKGFLAEFCEDLVSANCYPVSSILST